MEKKYICKKCDKEFSGRQGLNQHYKYSKSCGTLDLSKSFTCEYCLKVLRGPSSMTAHKKVCTTSKLQIVEKLKETILMIDNEKKKLSEEINNLHEEIKQKEKQDNKDLKTYKKFTREYETVLLNRDIEIQECKRKILKLESELDHKHDTFEIKIDEYEKIIESLQGRIEEINKMNTEYEKIIKEQESKINYQASQIDLLNTYKNDILQYIRKQNEKDN